MLSTHFALAFLLFITQITTITCNSITHSPHGLHTRVRERERSLRRTALHALNDRLSQRDNTPERAVESRQAIGGGGSNATAVNAAINTACRGAISQIEDFNSDSGLGGCYNIMYLNRTTGLFQADLRLYKVSEPTGPFSGIPIDSMLVNLNSNFAQFAQVSLTPNTKRAQVEARQSTTNYAEVLEGLWVGQIESLDYSKLSEADFMALVIPEFDIRALQPNTQRPVNSQLNISSAVYFVTGNVLAQSEQQAITATKASSALAAVAKASVFVLPGTTFGIFPIGFLVTGSWAVLFVLTFGLGTVGRMRYRSLYRSRLVALGRMRSL
jgi:hypothetical protein